MVLLFEEIVSRISKVLQGRQHHKMSLISLLYSIPTLLDGSTASSNVIEASNRAAARWEQIIVGDLSDQGAIDDFEITVQAGLLGGGDDGAGGVLANAGPDLLRSASDANPFLPYTASTGVDMADAGDVEALTEIMIHEFGHALGFVSGVLSSFNYIDGAGNFIGPNALSEYNQIVPGASSVPMQTSTSSHWDETAFGTEIMTPFYNVNSVVSTLTVGAFEDIGYTVDYSKADVYTSPSGAGLFPPGAISGVGGVLVRGQEITVESVWDDTDMTHILLDEIIVDNFHSETGLQLRSKPDESLIVKLQGSSAGFTATGTKIDIDDRIGGVVQILGQPNFPVILTSLGDDTVGASTDILGFDVTDTNLNGSASEPRAGDWRSLEFLPLSHDRNVAVFVESESVNTKGLDKNGIVDDALYLGFLAPNFAISTPTVTNTSESAQEKSGSENKRLGFEVHGAIAFDSPSDVDIYAFNGYAGSEVWIDVDKTSSSLDAMVELLDASGEVVLARSLDSQRDALDFASIVEGALPLEKDGYRGGDFYTRNPRDPGFRVILPGVEGEDTRYFIRVRSQPTAGATLPEHLTTMSSNDDADVQAGKTSGTYELRARLKQRDDKPGSTVQFADIRYPTIGIDVQGLPSHSPLTGENGENQTDDNDTFEQAHELGNLLASDRGTISVAGEISEESDIDWYKFDVDYVPEQDGPGNWATMFDIDYADGFRGDLTLSVFDAAGTLIFVGRDSDIADDQPGENQENDFDDVSRGSIGTLDPYIGSVHLPEGPGNTYYVAVSSNDFMPAVLDGIRGGATDESGARLEAVSSVQRVVEDHINHIGYHTVPAPGVDNHILPEAQAMIDTTDATTLDAHIRKFTMDDVLVFVSTGNTIRAYDLAGNLNYVVNETTGNDYAGISLGDLDMRPDGRLFTYAGINTVGGGSNGNAGRVAEVDTGDGTFVQQSNDAIANRTVQNPTSWQTNTNTVLSFAFDLNPGDS